MAIILNDNIDTRAPKPTDNRFGPYTTTAAALANIPEYQRYVGLTVGVGTPIVEYWFDSTLTLVLKTSSGTVTGITAGIGINIGGTAIAPIISVTSPTQLTTNISTDVIADGASDIKYPSVKATKNYVDANIVGLLDDRGNFPATSGNYPTTGGSGPAGAIRKGDLWFISVPGNLKGIAVGIGASVRALIDDAQPNNDADWDILDAGLGFIPENVANKVIRGTSIAAAPTSETQYASLSALTEYLESIPPSTPTLEQVLAATPTQTAEGYDINLESLDGNLTTNVGRGEFNVTNVSAGTSVTVLNDAISITSINDEVFITSDTIEFNNNTLGTLILNAVQNNNTVTLPNQTATLIASVNSSIFADTSTGDITIPLIGSTGTENFIPKWSATGSTLTDSQIFDNGTNVGIGTATPAYKLDVNGNTRISEILRLERANISGVDIVNTNDSFRWSVRTDKNNNSSNVFSICKFSGINAIPFQIYETGNVVLQGNASNYNLDNGYRLDVNGEINTNIGIRLGTNGAKTGIYGGANIFDFWAGNNKIATWGLAFIGGTLYDHFMSWVYTTGTATSSAFRIASNLVSAGANSAGLNQLLINPTYTQGTFGTGTLRGVYYNPILSGLNTSTHIAFENTTGDNFLNSSSGNTLIGYSTSPLTPFKLDVNGEINTVTGVRIAVNGSKTGIYPYDNFGGGLDFWAANDRLATFRLTNPGGQHYLFDAGHTYNNSLPQLATASMVIKGSVSPTGPNSVPITQLLINPTYAQTPSGIPRGTGTLRGIYYAPTVASLNTSAHVAFENTEGNVFLNSTSGQTAIGTAAPSVTAKLQIDSTTQGFLPPRMTTAEMNAIVNPEEGLIVFNISVPTLVVYAGGGWRKLSMESF